MSTEWANTGAAENVPLIMRAATTCESGIDTSGITNLFRRQQMELFPDPRDSQYDHKSSKSLSPEEALLLKPDALTPEPVSAKPTRQAHSSDIKFAKAGIDNTHFLRNQARTDLKISIDGPQGQSGGPGYLTGLFWAVVNLTVQTEAESSEIVSPQIRFLVGDDIPNCTFGSEYKEPFFLSSASNMSDDASEHIYIRAVACVDGMTVARQQQTIDLVPGPFLSITIATGNNSGEFAQLPASSLVTATCSLLSIASDISCDGRVSFLSNQYAASRTGVVGTLKVLTESNVEAAAWRKILISRSNLNVSEGGAISAVVVRIESVNVTVPVPNWRLIPVTEPCTSHYDCASQVTGQQLVNGKNVTQYGWGRSFCAVWGSRITNGAGPTCDFCGLYCTAASLTSVDGVCPENCGTPWAGKLPPCLSAKILQDNYNCESRRRFELWQHSSPANPPPDPQSSSVSYMRTMSPFNNILGAVVVTQSRASTVTCSNEGNVFLSSFTNAHNVTCVGPPAPDRTESGGYGVDPTFEVFSTLFDGKDTAVQYYNGQQVSDVKSASQENYNAPLEGYFALDGTFIPYGFFPHWWDQVPACSFPSTFRNHCV